MEATKHNHVRHYRVKIVPFHGPPEYGEWFATEAGLRLAMQKMTRLIGNRYYCESKMLTFSGCHVDEHPKVIGTL